MEREGSAPEGHSSDVAIAPLAAFAVKSEGSAPEAKFPPLCLPETLYKEMLAHCVSGMGAEGAKKKNPVEVCGILAGKGNRAERIYKGSNVDPSAVSYQLDPGEQLRIEKELRRDGLEMLAIYHSHPLGRAVPSPKDIELGVWETIYIIVGLGRTGEPEVKGWRFREEGKAIEAEIKIV